MSSSRRIRYLNYHYLLKLNKQAINIFKIKKADRFEILSSIKLKNVLINCKTNNGDLYDKAICLLVGLVKAHCFSSGNRRTALLAVFVFAKLNFIKIYISNNPYNSRILTGIRENYYTYPEIRYWLKHGKIKEFRRK
ncbi:Fic family protein [Candidatus Woesearchaeota archaeon]|nr:Fic family protein [Candidatus Woesearchaeota archaeon]